MMHKHVLKGCQPTPLAHYLKALGILRLVSEQKDPACRGAWQDDYFVLATRLSPEELEHFFLKEYAPTAIMDPWNGGSGFYPKDNKKAIQAILSQANPRLENLQSALNWSVMQTEGRKEAPKEEEKQDLQSTCLQNIRGSALDAIQAAMVLFPEGKRNASLKAAYPSLLGTGWNDGRLDFANNYHQRIAEVFDLLPAKNKFTNPENRMKQSLWADLSCENKSLAIGQFLPGAAGGANSSTGADGDSLVNPWDFILMLEGAVLFSASATKRLNPAAQVQASAPFSIYNNAVGSNPLSDSEESQRGEQWMPLWNQWVNLAELKSLLAEGRAQIGKSYAARPVDMARAVSRLGMTRGIDSFVRYGYLERNGQANFAVPLGRIPVPHHPRPRSYLVDDLAPWMERLHRKARDKAPARLIQVERQLANAVFEALTHDDSPSRWQAILLAATEVEKLQVIGTGFEIGPIPFLSPDWIEACDDRSPEFRLALSLGGAYYQDEKKKTHSIRNHWLPLDEKTSRRYATSDKRLSHDVRVVAQGRNTEQDLLAVLMRRHLESSTKESRHPQILARKNLGAAPADLAAWTEGRVDSQRCVDLARAFMAIDWWKWNDSRQFSTAAREKPEDAWCALKLCTLSWKLKTKTAEADIPLDPAILRRLQSGNPAEALRIALQRLNAHGIRPALGTPLIDIRVAQRWASALLFPISPDTAHFLFKQLQPKTQETSHVH